METSPPSSSSSSSSERDSGSESEPETLSCTPPSSLEEMEIGEIIEIETENVVGMEMDNNLIKSDSSYIQMIDEGHHDMRVGQEVVIEPEAIEPKSVNSVPLQLTGSLTHQRSRRTRKCACVKYEPRRRLSVVQPGCSFDDCRILSIRRLFNNFKEKLQTASASRLTGNGNSTIEETVSRNALSIERNEQKVDPIGIADKVEPGQITEGAIYNDGSNSESDSECQIVYDTYENP